MIIDVYPVVGIAEVGGSKDFINEDNLKTLQNETEKKLEIDLQSLIKKLQKDYDSDVLGFEQIFDQEKPKENKQLKKDGEDIFACMNTEVKVHLEIKGSGRTMKSIHKTLIFVLVGLLIVPQVTFAAWWNPFTWGISKRVQTQQAEVKKVVQPSEIEKLRSEIEELKKRLDAKDQPPKLPSA